MDDEFLHDHAQKQEDVLIGVIPSLQQINRISLKKGEVLVWGLDFDQYKNQPREKTENLMGLIRDKLKELFPDNKVLVTIGKVDIQTIKGA